MNTVLFAEDIPSRLIDLVNSLKGRKLVRLIRYSWEPEKKAIEEYGLAKEEVFSLTAGPLLMYFDDGLVVGSSSNPSRNSVVLWVEKNEAGRFIDRLSEDSEELFAIDSKDQYSWNDYLNKKIDSLKIIKGKMTGVKMEYLPNEVGLLVSFEGGLEFILSHGLHDGSDDFSVIKREQISKDILGHLSMPLT